jgi:hypothetical protein
MGYTIKICARKHNIEIISNQICKPMVENHLKRVIKLSPNHTIFDNSTDCSEFRIKRLGATALLDGYRR